MQVWMTVVPPEADAQRRGFSVSSVSADGRQYAFDMMPESGRRENRAAAEWAS